ncbi:hypothetical protein V6N13_148760 [Hibiscus sabdariffa]
MVTADGVWKWEVFSHVLPPHVLLHIVAISLPLPSFPSASIAWNCEALDSFSIWSAYTLCSGEISGDEDPVWKFVHHFNGSGVDFGESPVADKSSRLLVERTMTAIREVNDGVRATLLRRSWEVHVLHVLRCDNSVADCLAKPANSDSTCVIYFEDPPPFIVQILQRDVASISVTHD